MDFAAATSPPAGMRAAYLDELPHAQELYVENMVQGGRTLLLQQTAYAVIFEDTLVEFYVSPDNLNHSTQIFAAVLEHSAAARVLCKSFDHQLLFPALARPARVQPTGLLFRSISNPAFTPRADVHLRPGTAADVAPILAINDGFFDSAAEINAYAACDGLFVLERHGQLIGCGIGKAVISGRPHIDIGMLVAAPQRGNGYGAYLIAHLKQHYLQQGLQPVCGCSIDNPASQHALIRAGFSCRHRLLQITY